MCLQIYEVHPFELNEADVRIEQNLHTCVC